MPDSKYEQQKKKPHQNETHKLLSDILEGSVGIMNNYNLCHIKTIEWSEIISGPGDRLIYVYKFTEPERGCVPCHESCAAGCWGEVIHLATLR